MKYYYIVVFATLGIHCLYADQAVVPTTKDYDLSAIPPLDTALLGDERKIRDAQAMESIKKIVQEVVDKKRKSARRKKGVHEPREPRKGAITKQATQQALTSFLIQQTVISQEIMDILQKQLDDPELRDKVVSLHLKSMPIKDVLALIGKSTGVQFVVDSDVTGSVQEMKFDGVPLSAALKSILSSNEPHLSLIKDMGIWRVMKVQTAKDFLAGLATREREKEYAASVIPIVYAKWNDALKTRIEKLWQGITLAHNDKNNCYLVLDEVNRKIFFKGRKTHVEEFTRCLHEIDVQIPQIRIDARVVLTSKDFEEVLGFNWSGVYNRRESVHKVDFVGLGPIDKCGNPTDQYTRPFNDIIGWSLNLVPCAAKAACLKVPFIFGNKDLTTKRLNLELNAAENRNELQTILKPSLLVCNEESAEILVGESMPHEVRLDESVDSKMTNVTTVNYKDIGMKLKVKPTVTPDHNSVFLDVFVENSFVARPRFIREQGAGPLKSFNYTIKTSRSTNRVLLKSGQTTMISGLISNIKNKETNGIPFLEEIPIFGWLFKARRKDVSDEQLLIFITPTLVNA
jgi:type IV pilus assembly protein PilQ